MRCFLAVTAMTLAALSQPAMARQQQPDQAQPPVQAAQTPVQTQDTGMPPPGAGETVRYQVVYGNDKCDPAQSDSEIVVCARLDESERFRIPPELRGNPNAPANQSWSNRVQSLEMIGRTGTGSCSPIGAGGFTGCTQRLIAQARAERAQNNEARFGLLVQQERERRLSTIDKDAAEQQARVEAAEKAYLEKQGKDQETAEKAEDEKNGGAAAKPADPNAPHD